MRAAVLLGEVVFGECFRYATRAQWRADEARHGVAEGSPYDWPANADVELWGWVVKSVRPFAQPAAAPLLLRQMRSLFTLG